MADLVLPTEDVLLHIEAATQQEVFDILCHHLLCREKVKPEYESHLSAREHRYPTGLELGAVNVAIPHTDAVFARTTQLLVATLASPVSWRTMQDPDREIPVAVVIQSIFEAPEHQLETLRRVMAIVQDQRLVMRLYEADDPRRVASMFNTLKEF